MIQQQTNQQLLFTPIMLLQFILLLTSPFILLSLLKVGRFRPVLSPSLHPSIPVEFRTTVVLFDRADNAIPRDPGRTLFKLVTLLVPLKKPCSSRDIEMDNL